jgi:hypothetical protein
MEGIGTKIDLPKINKIIGKTEINHKIRKLLDISNDEYCVVDLVERCHARGIKFSYEECFRRLGMTQLEIDVLIRSMEKKRIVMYINDNFKPSNKWTEQFEISKDEFEAFWVPVKIADRTIRWTGSKTDCMNKYKTARKQYESSYLYKQKCDYFNLLFENPDRMVMMGSAFLSLTTKRFEEDWASQLKRKIPIAINNVTKLNREDLMND